MERIIEAFDAKILSSSHINFLFGSGINGKAFPQTKNFTETIGLLESIIKRSVVNYEDDLASIEYKRDRNKVHNSFKKEYAKYNNNLNYNHPDILDIKKLFESINIIVQEAENRTITMKQVNIYTLNYDNIVEWVLLSLGFLSNTISSSNIDNHDKFFNMIGYDYGLKRYTPTYLISKIHGDIKDAALPGEEKYDDVLTSKKFELFFKMKSQLSRSNSILFVIGYSGGDRHVNRILKDCVVSGLTVYWFRYNNNQKIPDELNDNVYVVNQEDNENPVNSSIICSQMLRESWDTKLEE